MKLLPLVLFAWLAFSLEMGLKEALTLGGGGIAPSFVLVLMTWVALGASPQTALWTAIALGAGMDLASPRPFGDGNGGGAAAVVFGPYALGYLLAAQLTLTLRGVMFRRSPYTLALLTVLTGLVSGAVVVSLLFVRSMYEPLDIHATAELLRRSGGALYSGGAALVLSPVLLALNSTMGFHQVKYAVRPSGRF